MKNSVQGTEPSTELLFVDEHSTVIAMLAEGCHGATIHRCFAAVEAAKGATVFHVVGVLLPPHSEHRTPTTTVEDSIAIVASQRTLQELTGLRQVPAVVLHHPDRLTVLDDECAPSRVVASGRNPAILHRKTPAGAVVEEALVRHSFHGERLRLVPGDVALVERVKQDAFQHSFA